MRTTISIANCVWAHPYLNTRDFVKEPIFNSIRTKIKNRALRQISQIHTTVSSVQTILLTYYDTKFE